MEARLLSATGHSPHGENEVSAWQNVTELIPGRQHTLALCSDGTVLTAGRGYGQPYAVSGWKNVQKIYLSGAMAAAVTAAGTVYALWADTNEPPLPSAMTFLSVSPPTGQWLPPGIIPTLPPG